MTVIDSGRELVGGYWDGRALLSAYDGAEEIWAAHPSLPVALDAIDSAVAPTIGTTQSRTLTVAAKALILVDIVTDRSAAVTSCTWAGVAMTLVDSVNLANDATKGVLRRYRIWNETAGTKTCVTTIDTYSYFTAVVSSHKNVNPDSPVGVTVKTNGSTGVLTQGPVPCPSDMHGIVQTFGLGQPGSILSGLAGGTTRYNQYNQSGMAIQTGNASATFTGTSTVSLPWGGLATVLNPAHPPILPAAPPMRLSLTAADLDSLSVTATGAPQGLDTLAGWNFYLDGVKNNTTLRTSPEWTYDGLNDATEYELTYTAVDINSVESDPSEPLVVSTLTDTALSTVRRGQVDSYATTSLSADGFSNIAISIRSPLGDYDRAYYAPNIPASTPMSLEDHFRMFSVTKSFTATAILQQVDQGNLALSDPLDTYVSGVPNGNLITIEHLLKMRAGLVAYDTTQSVALTFYFNGNLAYNEDNALNTIRNSTPVFTPGTDYLYSNSNFVLLGHVLEAVTGRDIRAVLADDVIAPAGLTKTSWPSVGTLPDPFAHGYMAGMFGGYGVRTQMNPDFLGAAGGLVTTVGDLRKWAEVMRDGALLSPASHAVWESTFCPVPYGISPGPAEFGYGLGLIQFGEWLGHDGSYPGYECCTFYHPPSGTVIATMGNYQTPSLAVFSKVFANIANYLYPGSLVSPGYDSCDPPQMFGFMARGAAPEAEIPVRPAWLAPQSIGDMAGRGDS